MKKVKGSIRFPDHKWPENERKAQVYIRLSKDKWRENEKRKKFQNVFHSLNFQIMKKKGKVSSHF